MKDLSKKERLEQDISRLEQEIYEMADKCGDKKWLRVKRTFWVASGAIYLIELLPLLTGEISNIHIDTICALLFAPPFAAGFIMFISYGILYYIIDGSMKEEKAIAKKIGELNAVETEKRNNLEDEKINELKRRIEFLENYQEKLIEENVYLRLNKVFDNDAEE